MTVFLVEEIEQFRLPPEDGQLAIETHDDDDIYRSTLPVLGKGIITDIKSNVIKITLSNLKIFL